MENEPSGPLYYLDKVKSGVNIINVSLGFEIVKEVFLNLVF